MYKEPLISVIVYINEKVQNIEKCLKTLSLQIYKNLEIIVVDDGSSDKTLETCKKQSEKDNRIKVFHKENEGVIFDICEFFSNTLQRFKNRDTDGIIHHIGKLVPHN